MKTNRDTRDVTGNRRETGTASSSRRETGIAPSKRRETGTAPSSRREMGATTSNRREMGATPSNRRETGTATSNRREMGATPSNRRETGTAPSNRREMGAAPSNRRETGTATSNRRETDIRNNNRSEITSINSNRRDPREDEIKANRAARRQVALRKKRQKKIKQITNYIKVGIGCAAVAIFLAIFVFKTPIEAGTEFLQAGNYDEAILKFSEGLSDLDYIAESYKGIGIAYYELGQYKDAVDNLENAIQKGQSSHGSTYYLLAISYMKISDYQNALKNITSALSKSGNSEELEKELRFNEVLCMELTSDWEGAKAKATSYMQYYPDDTAMTAEYEFLASR